MKAVVTGALLGCFIIVCPKHCLANDSIEYSLANDSIEYSLANIERITGTIQNEIFKAITSEKIGQFRSIGVLFYCGEKELFLKHKPTKHELYELIIEKIDKIKMVGGEKAKFLFSLNENEMIVLITGIYYQLLIYNQGFIDSIRYHFRIDMMSNDNYCDIMVQVAVEILNE